MVFCSIRRFFSKLRRRQHAKPNNRGESTLSSDPKPQDNTEDTLGLTKSEQETHSRQLQKKLRKEQPKAAWAEKWIEAKSDCADKQAKVASSWDTNDTFFDNSNLNNLVMQDMMLQNLM